MYKISWDPETGGVQLHSQVTPDTLGVAPRPVFYEELDLLKLNTLGWIYPRSEAPLLWACNKQYFYHGTLVFEAKGANIYDQATLVFHNGADKGMNIEPVDVEKMLQRNNDFLFLLESEAIEFIRDTYLQYAAPKTKNTNEIDYNALLERVERKTKQKMALVKEDCDSFDIEPLEAAKEKGKRIYHTAKVDYLIASFSGGKDSQVVLDLCTRAIPSTDFQVIYSDTGYELPPSLELYEETKRHYTELYPDLKFSIARNHDSVLNYWDKIGTPSDTHRWCCSVMKTAPLYRMLKVPGTNKQAKVLAFEGTRAEESVRRGHYERIGRGVKHNNVINARPILLWNTTEIFLYLFSHRIILNSAYRKGKPRVGCLICPFSSEWDDMIVNKAYTKELKPFLQRLTAWAESRNIPNLDEYIKGHKWKMRASGKYLKSPSKVTFKQQGKNFTATIENSQEDFFVWIKTLGVCMYIRKGNKISGEIKYRDKIYSFDVQYFNDKDYKISFDNVSDPTFLGLLKRVIYKSTYCIQCEACEVECPTGALSVFPHVNVDAKKCIHCLKCLTFHAKGCIVADSINTNMADKNNEKLTGISGYGTFGFRNEWLDEFSCNREDFWSNCFLGKKQIPSFKSWLQDAEIIDATKQITPLGSFLLDNYTDSSDIVWEIIWINLCYKSILVKWFINNVHANDEYSKSSLLNLYEEQYVGGVTTFRYALDALFNTFASSPIGDKFHQNDQISKTISIRKEHADISEPAIVYSLYKYGEMYGIKSFRIEDLWKSKDKTGIFAEFCIQKDLLEKNLKSLTTSKGNVILAELNMGLDSITLNEQYTSLTVLQKILL